MQDPWLLVIERNAGSSDYEMRLNAHDVEVKLARVEDTRYLAIDLNAELSNCSICARLRDT